MTDEVEFTPKYLAHLTSDMVVDFVVVLGGCDCVSQCSQECIDESVEFSSNLEGTPDGGFWLQTWEDGGQRRHFAMLGGTYDPDRDAFIPPQTYPSWILNNDTLVWEPPVPHPTNFATSGWVWDETILQWIEVDLPLD